MPKGYATTYSCASPVQLSQYTGGLVANAKGKYWQEGEQLKLKTQLVR